MEVPALEIEEMPIVRALVRHVQRARHPLHVPGHKQGRLLPGVLSAWLGQAAKLDLTELPGLDNLHHPSGCIAQSQALAAQHYGSDHCFYSVNGSTAGVVAAILATVPEGGRILFLNACHQSAWRGVALAGALPVFCPPAFDPERGLLLPPDARTTARVLAQHRGLSAVFLTSPTYQGVAAPVDEIAQVVHDAGLPLIVDEAHGAHFGLAPGLPPHSVGQGADIVVQSVHKMLPGLTQTAWVHCTGPRVQAQRVAEMLRLFQSTSPSYLLLASIDAAQAWLRTHGAACARRALHVIAPLWEQLGQDAQHPSDPLRHWQPAGGAASSQRLLQRLEESGIFAEYGDALGVLSIFGLAVTERDVERYLSVLRAWRDEDEQGEAQRGLRTDSLWVDVMACAAAPVEIPPRQMLSLAREWVPLAAAAGRICAYPVTPYPPGVPVIWPGQRFSQELCRALVHMGSTGADVHGLEEGRVAVLV